MWCFLDDLRAFGINADQWTTAAQDDEEWRKTVEQGAERLRAEWIAAEKREGSPPTCSSLPCTTYDPPLLRLFQVNNGIWSFLDYVEDIASGRPLRLLQNL